MFKVRFSLLIVGILGTNGNLMGDHWKKLKYSHSAFATESRGKIIESNPKEKESFSASWINLENNKERIGLSSKVNPPRSGHISFVVPVSDDVESTREGVYVFGGYAEDMDDSSDHVIRYSTNDLWHWKPSTRTWEEIEAIGKAPRPRLVASCSFLDDRPVLVGGWDPMDVGTGGVILDTISELDLSCMEWKDFEGLTVPGKSGTSRHISVSLPPDRKTNKKRLLIHNHRCTDHVLLLERDQNESPRIRRQLTTGDFPSPRGLHAADLLGDDTVVFFGGAAQNGSMSNEVFILDLDSWKWTRINSRSTGPSERAAPCLCALNNRSLVMFGGAEATSTGLRARGDVWALNISAKDRQCKWDLLLDDQGDNDKKVEEGYAPHPRNAATLDLLEGFSLGEHMKDNVYYLLLHGGWSPFKKTFNDNFVLQLSEN
uniref:Uncharacterized protein n=1 Tax=Corethron hystrix TaxID=216773 RepID=A0A7S1B606_9STRA|mmetsp:Transcript_12814/g.28267  ORF Transcript_12814/g.28267 Transcript_12814/m.28267 type:complete len:430 (+) Transcript_12814:197-1486(+)|eukprot:CAMPEP_0113315910 /NCGR_PEP_ID=MMETSP0010_2-20120614/11389_1 /TAXON_ID=216773 ORGANISM="Corethron hystrix, Strain 308" /NCGR_SAMPLE_ID=MMETSP0010_2 /ASSEMBLY_ACC=CAM_ASM_000155 /LENGTH=429 /DNA_ID=CAMNT_0000172505 /DNA_START=197 /DNA_END=1486 /DNA_ORIENTATION=+ /assembly_acc=CAM_ASM_000155